MSLLPKWFFPATRLTWELERAGYEVRIERFFPIIKEAYPDNATEFAVFSRETNEHGWRRGVGHYTSDLPFEGLRISNADDSEVAKIMAKYAELPKPKESSVTA